MVGGVSWSDSAVGRPPSFDRGRVDPTSAAPEEAGVSEKSCVAPTGTVVYEAVNFGAPNQAGEISLDEVGPAAFDAHGADDAGAPG